MMLDLQIIGEGATTKIYRDGNTAIKLYENHLFEEVEHEAVRQQFAREEGLPVPAVFGVRRIDKNAVALDMEYIAGKTLIHSGMDKNERTAAVHMLVKLQCMVHKVTATDIDKQTDRLAWKIERVKCLNKSGKNRLLALLHKLDTGVDRLCHGDFHPLNVLYDGSKHWIIDWVDATAGDPLADVCRTYLIFKQHMTRSAGIYLRLYCAEAKTEPEDVLKWLPVVTAARLNEKMDDTSRTWMLGVLNRSI